MKGLDLKLPENYEAVSDKTIHEALKYWRRGAIGTLAFQYFYAERKTEGIGQCIMGLFVWGLFIECICENASGKNKLLFALFLVFLLGAISVSSYLKIKKGRLQDHDGSYIKKP